MYVVRVRSGREIWRCSALCVLTYCVCRRAGPLAWCIGRVVAGGEGSLWVGWVIFGENYGMSVEIIVLSTGTWLVLIGAFPLNLNFL